jgi:hypothetical protein
MRGLVLISSFKAESVGCGQQSSGTPQLTPHCDSRKFCQSKIRELAAVHDGAAGYVVGAGPTLAKVQPIVDVEVGILERGEKHQRPKSTDARSVGCVIWWKFLCG